MHSTIRLWLLLGTVVVAAPALEARAELWVVVTADTEGCAFDTAVATAQPGGALARRATALADLRKQNPSLVLIDAGNALFGPDSLAGGGQAVAGAYAAMKYDALNLSYRDFRLGKDKTLELVKGSGLPVVSANLLDEKTGKPLVRPFVVCTRSNGRRLAIIGVTEPPAALDKLPHLKAQLEGIKFQPPIEAIEQCLGEARRQAGPDGQAAVALAYYGSAQGLKPIAEKFAKDLTVIAVGGAETQALPRTGVAIVTSAPRGVELTVVKPGPDNTLTVDSVAVTRTVQADPAVEKLLAPFAPRPAVAVESMPASEPSPLPQALEPSKPLSTDLWAQSKALDLCVRQILLAGTCAKLTADADSAGLLVLQTEWTNRLEIPYEIPDTASHVYVVVNGRRLAMLHPRAADVPEHVSLQRIRLPVGGQATKGLLVFEMPPETRPVESLELRFYDTANGNLFMPLVRGPAAQSPKPLAGPAKNSAVELAVYGIRREQTLGKLKAPDGMTFLLLDLRGRSLAKDVAGNDALADLSHWREYMVLVVDGEHACTPHDGGTMPAKPRLVNDVVTGAEAAFLVPAKTQSLELRLDFPSLEKNDDGSQALAIAVEGAAPKPPDRTAIASATDEMFEVMIFGKSVVKDIAGAAAPAKHKLLVLDVSVANTGKTSEWFQSRAQIAYVGKDGKALPAHALTGKLPFGSGDKIWVPAGTRRTFQMAFQIAADDTEGAIQFRSAKEQRNLPIGAIPAASQP